MGKYLMGLAEFVGLLALGLGWLVATGVLGLLARDGLLWAGDSQQTAASVGAVVWVVVFLAGLGWAGAYEDDEEG